MTEPARPELSVPDKTSDIEEGFAARGDRAPSLLRLLLNWRDWNIAAKLAAVTMVPVVFAVVLGAMQIGDQVARADSYRRVDRLVAMNERLRSLVDALQRERTTVTVALAGQAYRPPADEQRAVDGTVAALRRAAGRTAFQNEITGTRFAEADARLGELAGLRGAIAGGKIDALGAFAGYTAIIGPLLTFDRAAGAEVIDPVLAETAAALHDLEMAKEEIRYQQAIVGIGLARGWLAEDQLAGLRASQDRLVDRIAEFRLDASPAQHQEFVSTLSGSGVVSRESLARAAASAAAGQALPVDAREWSASSDDTAGRAAAMTAALGAQLAARSAALQAEASDGAGVASVILLIALVVAAAVMTVVGRHLLRSLNVLRHSALDVAEHGLPHAVERIRDGGGLTEPVVEPVPVRSADEVGQVARAFEAVHRQALRLATEQASLRARYGDVFVNLARRSQGLVQRQLQLLERLERDEEDPEQLATLFQLDHLATRMRRNNENLMVLSGSELGRRNQRPATLSDLLRAAVSEIEQYQRVVLLPPPEVLIVGYAVGDLVRLVAELLDNATAFSAPDTQVTIAGHCFEDGSVCVAILDEGIGMTESELAAANAKLSDPGTVDVSTSRRMGLFVVGRLASRHGVEVSLHGGRHICGVRATVTLPADLVTLPQRPEPATSPVNGHGSPSAPVNGSVNGSPANGMRPSPRPRTGKPLTEPSTPDIGRRLAGEDWVAGAAEAAEAAEEPPAGRAEPAADPPDCATDGERRPLPRRSPGSSRFVAPVDTVAGPVDLAVPGQPVSPADALFQPSGAGWWGTDDRSAVEETTPIFDEMVSAWFRAISDGTGDEAPDADPWRFASDEGFHAARTISESQPDSFTDSGLPRRNPKQNLLPGSAGAPVGEEPPATFGLDATELRNRLAGYQQGVARARDERPPVHDAAGTGAPAGPSTVDRSEVGRVPGSADTTSGGLPRRSPRPDPRTAGGDGAQAEADRAVELRGRLGNFQRGLTQGRRSLAELAERARALGDEIAAGRRLDDKQHDRESE